MLIRACPFLSLPSFRMMELLYERRRCCGSIAVTQEFQRVNGMRRLRRCVNCGSSPGLLPAYMEGARLLGGAAPCWGEYRGRVRRGGRGSDG